MFLPVADFALSCRIRDDKIEKAASVFQKLEEYRKKNTFKNLVRGKTVAIVGNGPSEIGKNKGEEIDAHDIVIRINNYETNGFEKDYGSRTDIWIRGFGGDDVKDYSDNHTYLLSGITGNYSYIPLFFEHQLDILYRDLLIKKIPTCWIAPEDYINLHIDFHGEPTTGFAVIYSLLHSPKCKFDCYGFSFLQEQQESYATHYFNDRDEKEAKERSAPHNFFMESDYLRKKLLKTDCLFTRKLKD